ncbi:MAG TPA: glycine oxidase ThiO [Micromonosporaceae bacterium]|nr:glycine oxidase ThiO [Micromonosporaceae bacterium]
MSPPDVAVVGGGVIGLAIAWRCAQRGLRVTVHDPDPGSGASSVAAGMLAPVTEAHFGEEPLLSLALAAARAWPDFAAELSKTTGESLGYRTDGTLLVAYTDDDLREIQRLYRFYESLGLPAQPVTGREARSVVPLLAPRVRGGMVANADHQVDPRRLSRALLRAVTRAGVSVRRERVARLADLTAGQVVLAAGCWTGQLAELPVHPVKGQVLRLRTPGPPEFRLTVRALAGARPVYLVPRADGEVVVGATMEEQGYDVSVTAGGVHQLLRAAIDVVPEVAEYRLVETSAGLRPGTPDNAPLLGVTSEPRVIAATGHNRQGILLTPVTADAITELLVTGQTPQLIAPFDPRRFHRVSVEVGG